MRREYLTEYGKAVAIVGFAVLVLAYVLWFAPMPTVEQVLLPYGG